MSAYVCVWGVCVCVCVCACVVCVWGGGTRMFAFMGGWGTRCDANVYVKYYPAAGHSNNSLGTCLRVVCRICRCIAVAMEQGTYGGLQKHIENAPFLICQRNIRLIRDSD